jgi:hypothetical protein
MYAFGETLADVPLPLALTHWSDTEVVIALPPLTCDPKILKIMLPVLPPVAATAAEEETGCDGNTPMTLQHRVYFPTWTPGRQAHMMYRNDGEDGKAAAGGRLYLVLDNLVHPDVAEANGVTMTTEDATTRPASVEANQPGETCGPELGQASPPVVLR